MLTGVCPAWESVTGADSGPTRRVGARDNNLYPRAFTILIAFIGEIKSAPALSKHRVRHHGICLLLKSLNSELKFPSSIFSIPIVIDTSIIISRCDNGIELLTSLEYANRGQKGKVARTIHFDN